MAEETKKMAEETTPEVVVSDVTVMETPQPEPEKLRESPEKPAAPVTGESKVEGDKDEKDLVAESTSFKEESNKVEELPNPEQKALAEFKQLIQEALNTHEFTSPPPPPSPPAAKEKEEEKNAAPAEAPEAEPFTEVASEPVAEAAPKTVEVELVKKEEKVTPPETKVTPVTAPETPSEPEKVEAAEEIKETIVEVPAAVAVAAAEEEPPATDEAEEPKTECTPPPPEEVSIWGISLLADERSDVILLKFLRARDFKVKEAFTMLKSVVAWRKEFKIDELLDEKELGQGLEKVVYNHGLDKEGHPVCYNAFGEFQNKELYQNTFADKEKLTKFLRWRIQFMEKSIRNLDFSPDGICTFVQVIDLKNSPGLFFFKKELRQATNRALQLLQDNYPEFVAKQVFINVPWWYPAYYRMINAIFTTRTKSKFVFAGPSRSAETLFKYITPEQVPVQYGGLSKEGEQEFTIAEPATEDIIKPASKHTIEFPVTEKCTLVWEARVTGWDVSYGAEFVPTAEGGYTIIIEKSRKVGANEKVISNTYKAGEPGKVVITFDNQSSKKKKLVYRSKNKPSD
ncbi:patellin-3-like [Nicotiana tomentosiformis]|uniref:patellin-3-like n=1 Tax=Nicotiana tomentosiformis TaxID=4098 RepID=UPI00051BA958|nr:patellin-3-like [Nicotiana tomentosiformis]